ncbi:MAG: methyl-accepting chemotaxis protein [Burkholderiales bacterium]
MKNNQPVTQREVDYDESDVFVTKTDLRGIVTYANESFCRIAGFGKEELEGKNHNVVRHPDMPPWAFEDLWKTVKAGFPWRGLVKNRCKSGDHYWVKATVVPILRRGEVTGYLSLRKKPSRGEVYSAEELYREHMKTAPKRRISVKRWFRNLKLQHKMQVTIQPFLLVLLTAATYFVWHMMNANMLRDAEEKAEAVAMQVIDSANMLMVTGAISDPANRRLMIKKIIEGQHLYSLRLERTEQVVKQFGAGLPEEHLDDALVRSTIERSVKAGRSVPFVDVEMVDGRPVLRAITPYIESHDFHGTDCLSCHQVDVGSSNGASDIRVDMSKPYKRIHETMVYLIAGQVALQVAMWFFIGWVARRFVAKPVEEAMGHLNDVVDGDFSGEVDIDGRDEIGRMLCSVQATKVLMGSMVDQIRTTAKEINKHADHLADSVERASEASHSQSEASHNMAANIEEISVSIDQVADNASEVHRISESSRGSAIQGGSIVRDVMREMKEIGEEVMVASKSIKQLGERSNEITEVVKIIQEIADKTNLLALNAAIEAARAGDHGRGFAVVADEVRKLAEQTKQSTIQIAKVIDGISQGMNEASSMIHVVVDKVRHGEVQAKSAGESIVEIEEGANKVMMGVADISTAIHQQSAATRDISGHVEKTAQMAEENAVSIHRVDESAKTLEELAGNLNHLTESFRI